MKCKRKEKADELIDRLIVVLKPVLMHTGVYE